MISLNNCNKFDWYGSFFTSPYHKETKTPVSCCPPAVQSSWVQSSGVPSSEERWSSVQSLNATPTPRYLRARRGRDVFSVRQSWGTEMTSRPKTSIRQKQMSEHQFGLVNTDGQMGISRLPAGRAAARASLCTTLSRAGEDVRARSRRAPHSLFYRRLIGHILFSARLGAPPAAWSIGLSLYEASRRLPENRTPALRLWVRGDENTLDGGYRQRQPQFWTGYKGIHSKL